MEGERGEGGRDFSEPEVRGLGNKIAEGNVVVSHVCPLNAIGW